MDHDSRSKTNRFGWRTEQCSADAAVDMQAAKEERKKKIYICELGVKRSEKKIKVKNCSYTIIIVLLY